MAENELSTKERLLSLQNYVNSQIGENLPLTDGIKKLVKGDGANVTMEDNPDGGVDLTVDDQTRTLATEGEVSDVKAELTDQERVLTDHEERIKALEDGEPVEPTEVITELTFSNGWIDTSTGKVKTNATRVITEQALIKAGDKLIIEHPTYETDNRWYSLAYYDEDGTYRSYKSWVNINESTLEFTFDTNTIVAVGIKRGDNTNIDASTVKVVVKSDVFEEVPIKPSTLSRKFYAEYETVNKPCEITDNYSHHLSLIAIKRDDNGNSLGYLYADEFSSPQKLYYSANRYDRPKFLCDWKRDIIRDTSESISRWCPIITNDGDIIFLIQGKQNIRINPVVYPHNDYNNPIRMNLSPIDGYLPSGLTTDTGACISCAGDFVLFGEYHRSGNSALQGYPMRIWKVSKPYTNASDWKVVFTQYYTAQEQTEETNEITHWHTVCLDKFTGNFYANTGDADWGCKVFVSTDDGENWTRIAVNGQHLRTLGYIFTEDGAYWGTDSSRKKDHCLFFAPRNEDGIIDFSQYITVAECRYDEMESLNNLQRTYNTCLLRNPNGILLLDRAEERYDGLLNLEFYSFDDKTLHLVDILHKLPNDDTVTTRYGFGNFAVTYEQSVEEDGIICGSMNYERFMTLDMLGNSSANRIGVTKISIKRMNR